MHLNHLIWNKTSETSCKISEYARGFPAYHERRHEKAGQPARFATFQTKVADDSAEDKVSEFDQMVIEFVGIICSGGEMFLQEKSCLADCLYEPLHHLRT